jgi:predicted nucleic acid-binding protein
LTGIVVDACVALAWCFPDEGSDYADKVLVALNGISILVRPFGLSMLRMGSWSASEANACISRKSSASPRCCKNLSVVQDAQPAEENLTNVLPLAREYGLSVYDAAYLELSLRHSAPLATLDQKLRKAAQKAGARLFASVSDPRQ